MAEEITFPGLRAVLRNGLYLAGVNWAEALLRAVYVLVIARVLGSADYGLWSYVTAAYMFGVTATVLGLDMLVTARLGRDREHAAAVIETSLAMRLALLAAAAVLLGIFALLGGSEPPVALGLAIALFALFGRGMAMWSRPVFVGLERADMAFRITLVCRFTEVVLGVALLILTRNILALLVLHAFSWLTEAAISYVRARRLAGFARPRFHAGETRPLVRAGLPIGATTLCIAALNAAPVLIATWLGAPLGEVGQLGIAIQFATLAVMAIQGFLGAAVPALARAIERDDAHAPHYGWLVAAVVLTCFSLLTLLAHYLGEPVIIWLVGESYRTGASLLTLAFVVGGLSLVANGFWHEQMLRQRQTAGVVAGLAGLLTLALTVVPLWKDHGLEGLLLAACAGWLARALILIGAGRSYPE